jgi:hypothetical protein
MYCMYRPVGGGGWGGGVAAFYGIIFKLHTPEAFYIFTLLSYHFQSKKEVESGFYMYSNLSHTYKKCLFD